MDIQLGNLLIDERPPDLGSPDDGGGAKGAARPADSNRRAAPTLGVATSFGFKRASATAARRLADGNGNSAADTASLTGNAAPTGRSTPKLVPPKREAAAAATRGARFGFRNTQGSRQNKVGDVNCPIEVVYQNRNNNVIKKTISASRTVVPTNNNNPRSLMMNTEPSSQIGRFTLQSTNLPRPEPIRLIETKTAKTLANNNRRVAGLYQQQQQQRSTPEDNSSKDGSLTEDSGLGSHQSGSMNNKNVDGLANGIRGEDGSPTFGARRRRLPRSLEVVVTGKKTFDLRDMDESNDSCDSLGAPPLPQLPSAFHSAPDNRNSSHQALGLVRERTLEYQGHIDRRQRKLSKTSSEGFSDEEKPHRDKFKSEKVFLKAAAPHTTFLKSRANRVKEDSSPPSSDEQEWGHGGEAMADDVSFTLSSSDESKDRLPDHPVPISAAVIGTALQSLMAKSFSKSVVSTASDDVKSVMLNIEDPKFAAVAAASNTASLLDDETLLSPSESVTSFSESGDKKKQRRSSSNSKEINERPSSSSPGTPTNASNSLSISDGKDDFLIDDEIADQPSLVFEDAHTLPNENSTETMIGSTPVSKRKVPPAFFGSPLSTRSKKFSMNRTGSLDTLSPCESIASDDLMMDFCVSQSSGLEDYDGHSSGYPSINETIVNKNDTSDSGKTWEVLVGSHISSEKQKKSTPTRTRLLASRTPAAPSPLPEAPRAGRPAARPSAACSPARLARLKDLSCSSQTGYDSDDSLRLDKTSHAAIQQDIVGIKTMLLKLRRVLNESDAHNPFDSAHPLSDGIFDGGGPPPDDGALSGAEHAARARLELADLGRQVLFLRGQLEDRERSVEALQAQVGRLSEGRPRAGAEARAACNAATQTERIRPISAGPSLLTGSPVDGSAGSLVSANENSPTQRRSRLSSQTEPSKQPPSRLWRQPGEPPSPQRYASNPSLIPRRAQSRTRTPASTT